MASQSNPKMSLVAQYDDICRYTKVLTAGCEEEFRTFIVNQKKLLMKWKEAEAKIQALKMEVTALEAQKSKFECHIKHMKNLVEEEISKRRKYESEKVSMERQLALIKEILLANGATIDSRTTEKLVSLTTYTSRRQPGDTPKKIVAIEDSIGSLLSESDVDDTEDFDVATSCRQERHSRSRRSSRDHRKLKNSDTKLESQLKEVEFDMDVYTISEKNETTIRSNSEPSMITVDFSMPRMVHKSDSEQMRCHTSDQRITVRLSGGPSVGRYSTGGKLSRTHAFVSKMIIKTEKCYPCGKIVKFCKQALKCSDCRITCHPECRDQCPLPCVPVTCTPTKAAMGTIADYTSVTSPMIPSLIVHCVNEIESRGLKETGLYRKSGSEREVKELKGKLLRGKSISSLTLADIHAVCGTVKEFLRSLKEPLITRSAWQVFIDSAEHEDETMRLNLIFDAVCILPQPNKETLVFLILHLQRVAESTYCRMPLENLAKIFGPTIVGYSSTNPSDSNMLSETRQQCLVMNCLLMIPSDLWLNILNIESPEVFQNSPPLTPECLPAPKASRLGPIHSSDQKKNPVEKTPLAPRNLRNTIRNRKSQLCLSTS